MPHYYIRYVIDHPPYLAPVLANMDAPLKDF